MLETAVSQHPEVRESLAWMHLSLGQFRYGEGQVEPAKAAFRAAAECYQDAFAKEQNAGILWHWGECYKLLIQLPLDDLQFREAEEVYRQFFQVQSRIPADLKAHPALREQSGHVRNYWASRLRGAGRLKESEQVYSEAASVFDQLTIDQPAVEKYWRFAANTHREVADLMMLEGRQDEAEQELRRLVEWIETNQPKNEELHRVRADAEELLKITDEKSTTKPRVEVK